MHDRNQSGMSMTIVGMLPGSKKVSLSSREDMPPLRGVTAEVEGGAYLRGGVLVLPRNGSQNHCFRLRNRHKGDPNRKNFRLRRSNLTKFWGTMAEVEGGAYLRRGAYLRGVKVMTVRTRTCTTGNVTGRLTHLKQAS